MALLDVTQYDLTKIDGQSEAVGDIIDELNSQYDTSSLFNYLNIGAYGNIQVPVTDFGTSGSVYLGSFYHGLGYQPAFLPFYQLGGGTYGQSSTLGYFSLPHIIPGLDSSTGLYDKMQYWYGAYADSKSIYAYLKVGTIPGSTIYNPVGSQYPNGQYPVEQFYFYIFNIPMPIKNS